MRPKKRILLMGGNELERAPLAFTLRTHQYFVIGVDGPADPLANLSPLSDTLLVLWPVGVKAINMLRTRLRKMWGDEVQLIVLADAGQREEVEAVAPTATLALDVSMAELLERIKYACVRKRGPRKGSKRSRIDASTADCVQEVA